RAGAQEDVGGISKVVRVAPMHHAVVVNPEVLAAELRKHTPPQMDRGGLGQGVGEAGNATPPRVGEEEVLLQVINPTDAERRRHTGRQDAQIERQSPELHTDIQRINLEGVETTSDQSQVPERKAFNQGVGVKVDLSGEIDIPE